MPDVTVFIDRFMLDQLPKEPPAGTIEDELRELVAIHMSCKANDGSEVDLEACDVEATVLVVDMSRGSSIKVVVTAHDHHEDRMNNLPERLTAIKGAIKSWWAESSEGLPYVSVRFQPTKVDYWVFDE